MDVSAIYIDFKDMILVTLVSLLNSDYTFMLI